MDLPIDSLVYLELTDPGIDFYRSCGYYSDKEYDGTLLCIPLWKMIMIFGKAFEKDKTPFKQIHFEY